MSDPTRPTRGRFITFEGIDGAGKSTHLAPFADAVRARLGADRVVVTREPGGTALGERVRDLVLHESMHADTEALLMFAARREHLDRVIEPALARGDWVVSDRFTDASFAYQGGGRGVALERLALLERFTHPDLQPDLTILFDVDPSIARTRREQARAADRFEREAHDFHRRTRDAYLQRVAAQPQRFLVIDAGLTQDEVARVLLDQAMRRL